MGLFPNDAAIVRLVTTVCVETHDEWAVAERRYLSEESMAKVLAGETEPMTSPGNNVDVGDTPAMLTYTTPWYRPL